MINFNISKNKSNLSNHGKPSRDIIIILIEQFLLRAINFATFTIVARHVDMAEMGSIALAWTVLYFIETLTSSGLSTACIQHEHSNLRTKSTFFWANLVFGLMGLFFLYLLGLFGSTILDYLDFQNVATFLGIIYLLRMIGVAHNTSLVRDQEQDKLAMLTLVSALLSGALGIYLALIGLGIWAILWRIAIESALKTIISISCCLWYPKWYFDQSYFESIAKRAYPLIGANVSNLSVATTQQLVISSTLGIDVLGGVEVARKLPFIFVQTSGVVINRFLLPFFSNQSRKGRNNYHIMLISAFFGLLISLLGLTVLFIFKEKLLELVFGLRWILYNKVFYYICVGSVAVIFTKYFSGLLIAYGYFKISALQSIYLLISLPFFILLLVHSIELAYLTLAAFQCICTVHTFFFLVQKLKPS